VRWYRAAAARGHANAAAMLATMYEQGRGMPADQAEAVAWLRKAAALGHNGARLTPARALRDGAKGLTRDDAAAFALFKQVADTGDTLAQADLGFMYLQGRGTPGDPAAAAAQFRAAAGAGNAYVQDQLATLTEQGRGTQKDDAAALGLYRAATAQGFANAQANLGLAYRFGHLGLAADPQEAARLFRLAADQGNAFAQDVRGGMCNDAVGMPLDRATAITWYRRAATQGRIHVEAALGNLLGEAGQPEEAAVCGRGRRCLGAVQPGAGLSVRP
jgi:TPR repeat protein